MEHRTSSGERVQGGGGPFGFDVHAGIVVVVSRGFVVWVAGEEAFESKVALKTRNCLFVGVRVGHMSPVVGELRGRNKFETESQERAKVLGWGQSGGAIVKVNVGRPDKVIPWWHFGEAKVCIVIPSFCWVGEEAKC
jgi:hypothetical protein